MNRSLYILLLLFFLMVPASLKAQIQDLDAYWSEVSRTVNAGDFEGYAALYHADAVLVSSGSATSYPIQNALEGWKQGFVDTQAGKMSAEVSFRFSSRLASENTSHDTGIFHYQSTNADGETSEAFVHFEGLLVKKGGWLMLMEYQKGPATKEEWEALDTP